MTFPWEECKKKLKDYLGNISFDTWIAPLEFKTLDKQTITIESPDTFFKNWIESNYLSQIQTAIKEITGKDYQINIEVNPQLIKNRSRRSTKIIKSIGKTFQEEPQDSLRLNPRFLFENFIVGASNRMAHAASLAVANAPGKSYNPLFIYGGAGLGKTHLMQAIAHYVLKKNPEIKVKYLYSDRFVNELIMAIQNRATQRFRQKYRNVDILLIDDIQFIAGKEAVQEEFFHTFNVLYDYHKQIIISSDRPPKEIPKLEERLVSRFSWGLVVDIQPPDFETRVAILKKKLENEPIAIDDSIIYFIAENISTNIRELEGALVRIIAYSLMENKSINLELAKHILKDMVKEINQKITPQLVAEKVAQYFNIGVSDLKKSKRSKSLVLPRQICMHLIREFTNLSLPEIGAFLGAKHHTTILYAIRKLKQSAKKNAEIKSMIDIISQNIKNNSQPQKN